MFDSAGRQNMLSVFNGLSANGIWILFISDLSSGGETAMGGWGLQIATEAMPEPASLAMGAVLAVIGTAGFLVARRRSRSQ